MKKKNLKTFSDFIRENNTSDMDEMLRMSLKGGGVVGGSSIKDGTGLEMDGCLMPCTGRYPDWDIDGD